MAFPPEKDAGLDVAAFAARLGAMAGGCTRLVAALAGPPGSGKSTIAEAVAARLPSCAVLPMDGFHYDDAVLLARGWRAQKGAPHTFDVGGLAATLARLRANAEAQIAVPVFDRDLEIARAAARIVARETRIVLVEGNYLLLDSPPWSALRPMFDVTAMIAVPRPELRARLEARWTALGLPPAEVRAKVEGNDLPNGDTVLRDSREPDFRIDGQAPAG